MKQLEVTIRLTLDEDYMKRHGLAEDDICKCVTITPREAFVAIAATTFLPGTNHLADELFAADRTTLTRKLVSTFS